VTIKEWFVNLWTNAKGAVSKFFEGPGGKIVRDALSNTIKQAGAIGMSMLLDAARGKVSQLNDTQLSNDSKRLQALDYLKGYAIQQGLLVGESVLRYTIESAVLAVKEAKKND
jgi:hypothetical protein